MEVLYSSAFTFLVALSAASPASATLSSTFSLASPAASSTVSLASSAFRSANWARMFALILISSSLVWERDRLSRMDLSLIIAVLRVYNQRAIACLPSALLYQIGL